MKPVSRKIQVWLALHLRGHNPRRDVLLLFVAVLLLVALSEVVLDGLFASVPTRVHLPSRVLDLATADLHSKTVWASECVAKVPRLARPRFAPAYRLHTLNRYLFCLAASSLISDKASLFEANDGAGGAGFALFLGARLHPGRHVVVAHETNEQNLYNFGKDDQNTIGLTRDLEPLEALEKACERGAELLSVAGGEPLADFALATTALQCKSARVVAISGVDEAEINRVGKEFFEDWKILVISVDYQYYSPVAAVFCVLRIPLFCNRVPFVILVR